VGKGGYIVIYARENSTLVGGAKLLHHLYISNPADVVNLPGLDLAAPGSDAYCVSSQDVYILDGGTGKWVIQ
jgi:hypothetical protein